MAHHVWHRAIDSRVEAAIGEVLVEFPGAQISVRELLDERGVVAIVVTAGDGRLVIAARTVDLVPVAWPWSFADGVVGLLPRRPIPTVDEFLAGLTTVGVG
jgi:hypothetical protein